MTNNNETFYEGDISPIQNLQGNISSMVLSYEFETRLEEIEKKISSDASETNKLIDKNYVDSNKQEVLISGINIKTINENTILGSGNLNVDSMPLVTPLDAGKFARVNSNGEWDAERILNAEDNRF